MQFQGQSHILSVLIERPDIGVAELREVFAAAYFRRFGIVLPEISARAGQSAYGRDRRTAGGVAQLLANSARAPTLQAAQVGERRVWFVEGWQMTPVYARDRLPLDAVFDGPAILEQLDCTAVIQPGDSVTLDGLGNLLIGMR